MPDTQVPDSLVDVYQKMRKVQATLGGLITEITAVASNEEALDQLKKYYAQCAKPASGPAPERFNHALDAPEKTDQKGKIYTFPGNIIPLKNTPNDLAQWLYTEVASFYLALKEYSTLAGVYAKNVDGLVAR